MAQLSLEHRVAALEQQLDELKKKLEPAPKKPWWQLSLLIRKNNRQGDLLRQRMFEAGDEVATTIVSY